MTWDKFGEVPKEPCVFHSKPEKWDVYAKNKYCHKIKITNWWYHREGYPKDHDDVVNSAYKRLGSYPEDENFWKSETKLALEEVRGQEEYNLLKDEGSPVKTLNFLSYPVALKTRKDLLPEEIRKILPTLPKDELTLRYTTTNQSHYKKIHIKPTLNPPHWPRDSLSF